MNHLFPRPEPVATSGAASALSRAFDFAATTVVFSVVGWFVDRWAHTAPVFVIVFSAVALVGQFVRLYYSYTAEMRIHEAALHPPVRRIASGDDAPVAPSDGAQP